MGRFMSGASGRQEMIREVKWGKEEMKTEVVRTIVWLLFPCSDITRKIGFLLSEMNTYSIFFVSNLLKLVVFM